MCLACCAAAISFNEFVQKRNSKYGHKTNHRGRRFFSLEESRVVLGACTGAPAMQVNYDFYENLTPERTTPDFEAARNRTKAGTLDAGFQVRVKKKKRHPAESPRDQPGSSREGLRTNSMCTSRTGRLPRAWSARAQGIDAGSSNRTKVKKSNLRGARRRRVFPPGMKWSFVPKESAKPKYIPLQRPMKARPGTCKDRPLMEMMPHQIN